MSSIGEFKDQKEHKGSSHNYQKTLDDPQEFWEDISWAENTKVELFGRFLSCYIWHKTIKVFKRKNVIATVKHGGGSVMDWGCSPASGSGRLDEINGTMKSDLCWKILKEIDWPSV